MATATAEWTGVLVVGSFELDCRLFSAAGRAKSLPLRYIHSQCRTPLEEVKSGEPQKDADVEADVTATQVREQFFCLKCAKPLKADEVGRAVDTGPSLISISDEEIASLEFQPTKRVMAGFIQADDPALMAVGFSRRLYVMPKPAALPTYFAVYHTLDKSGRVGFISTIVMKRKAYVAILRPLEMPEVIFGRNLRILVVDVLNDTDQLRDPAMLPDFFGALPDPDLSAMAQSVAGAQEIMTRLDPELCVSPRRRKLKAILKQALARSLQK